MQPQGGLSDEEALVASMLDVDSTTGSGAGRFYMLGTLYHGAPQVSLLSGGGQALFLRAGGAHAGEIFVLLGSASGTSPGLLDPFSGLVLPLNVDAYFLLGPGGAGVLGPPLGILDATGEAAASFNLPAGMSPSLAGLGLHHAYAALDPATGAATLASNAVRVELVP